MAFLLYLCGRNGVQSGKRHIDPRDKAAACGGTRGLFYAPRREYAAVDRRGKGQCGATAHDPCGKAWRHRVGAVSRREICVTSGAADRVCRNYRTDGRWQPARRGGLYSGGYSRYRRAHREPSRVPQTADERTIVAVAVAFPTHAALAIQKDFLANHKTLQRMKTKQGFRLRPLGDEYILVGESVELINFNKMITMNATAAYLWREAEQFPDFDAQTLADLLLKEYEVSPEQALADAQATLHDWQEVGIIGN